MSGGVRTRYKVCFNFNNTVYYLPLYDFKYIRRFTRKGNISWKEIHYFITFVENRKVFCPIINTGLTQSTLSIIINRQRQDFIEANLFYGNLSPRLTISTQAIRYDRGPNQQGWMHQIRINFEDPTACYNWHIKIEYKVKSGDPEKYGEYIDGILDFWPGSSLNYDLAFFKDSDPEYHNIYEFKITHNYGNSEIVFYQIVADYNTQVLYLDDME